MSLFEGWEDQLESYFLENRDSSLLTPLLKGTSVSVAVNGCELMDSCPQVISAIILDPLSTLAKCDEILQKSVRSFTDGKSYGKFHFRISSMPNVPEFNRSTVPKSEDVGYFLSLVGTVIKTGPPKMLEYLKDFRCLKCGRVEPIFADFEQYYQFSKPANCPTCNSNAGFAPTSKEVNSLFTKDYQEIKIQEQVGNLSLGTIPRSIWVILEDDLVDSCKPGDDVMVIGVVTRRWRALGKSNDGRTDIELVVRANYIEVKNDQKSSQFIGEEQIKEFKNFWRSYGDNPLVGRDMILSSFCPQVYGLYAIKLAVAVVLCGGVERIDDSGTRVRGEPHLLMVGDPGTGKSQLLKYASKLSPRSVLTTGIGSTSAGLTVSAVRDSGEWHLEAGALVLADGGICCIDEFNSIKESDRTCIHEAMEQQSLSVAKAGLVCKLQTRCSVLAAANPKGRYDSEQPLSVNIAVASPLLSRFDLVLVLLDSRNEHWDRVVSSYLLQGKNPCTELGSNNTPPPWSFDKIRAYFTYCKSINPTLGEEAQLIIGRYYQLQRRADDVNMARTTVRLLQSVIRLAQGHARLVQHCRVEILDAIFAVILLENSMGSSSQLLTNSNPLHTTFPEDPLKEYCDQAQRILYALELQELWEKEEIRIRKISSNPKDVSFHSTLVNEDPKPDNVMLTQVISKLRSDKVNYIDNCVVEQRPRKKRQKQKTDKRIKKLRLINQFESEEEDLFEAVSPAKAVTEESETEEEEERKVTPRKLENDTSSSSSTTSPGNLSVKTLNKLKSFIAPSSQEEPDDDDSFLDTVENKHRDAKESDNKSASSVTSSSEFLGNVKKLNLEVNGKNSDDENFNNLPITDDLELDISPVNKISPPETKNRLRREKPRKKKPNSDIASSKVDDISSLRNKVSLSETKGLRKENVSPSKGLKYEEVKNNTILDDDLSLDISPVKTLKTNFNSEKLEPPLRAKQRKPILREKSEENQTEEEETIDKTTTTLGGASSKKSNPPSPTKKPSLAAIFSESQEDLSDIDL